MNNSPDMPKQDGIDLSYVDSYEEAVGKLSPEEREDVAKRYDEILSILTRLLAGLRWQKEHIEEQVEFDRVNPYVLPEERDRLLEYGEGMAEYFSSHMRIVFFEVDIYTARKYMLLAQSDWEYRYFARRLYTYMHETILYFDKWVKKNNILNNLRLSINEEVFRNFCEKRDCLYKFVRDRQKTIGKCA